MINFIKFYKIPIILILVIIILSGIFVIYKIDSNSSQYFVSILYIKKGNDTFELKVRNRDKVTLQVDNGVESVFSLIPRTGKERIAFPDLNKVEAKNTLEGRVQKSKLLWELTFMDSFRYVKYLIDKEGYKIEMYASTHQYIEIYLEKEGLYKRLIIFRDSIMVSDMVEDAVLPDFETYISKFRINKN